MSYRRIKTANDVKNLSAQKPEKPITAVIEGVSGLFVVAYIKVTFIARFSRKGKRYVKTLGHYPKMSLAQAKSAYHKFLHHVEHVVCALPTMLLRDYTQQHFQLDAIYRKPQAEQARLGRIQQSLGDYKLSELTPQIVNDWFTHELGDLSASTQNKCKALLSSIMQSALVQGLTLKNPVRGVKSKAEHNIQDRVLSPQEVKSFISAAHADENKVHAFALLFALFTGLRMGNVLNLRWDWISVDSHSVLLPMTKSGKSHRIYPNDAAKALLDELRSLSLCNTFVFPSDRADREFISYPRACLQRIQQRMQDGGCFNGHFTMHDLRRTYASYLLAATGDIRAVQQSLGHSCITTTERYAHHQPTRLAQASQLTLKQMTGDA